MFRKIVCIAGFPLIAVTFISIETVAVAQTPYNKQQLSSELLLRNTSSNSLLVSSLYDKDRDYDRECHRKYEEAYQDIARDRRNLYNDDNERDHRRHQRDLEQDYQRLHNLRNKYPDCDYRRDERDRDYRWDDRNHDYRNDRDYDRNYNDYPPNVQPLPR